MGLHLFIAAFISSGCVGFGSNPVPKVEHDSPMTNVPTSPEEEPASEDPEVRPRPWAERREQAVLDHRGAV